MADDRKKYPKLPALLEEIASIIGYKATVTFAMNFGGQRIYIPRRVSDDNPIVKCLGKDDAIKLFQHFRVGSSLELPLGPRAINPSTRERIETLDAMGLSSREIANALAITQRTVHRHRSATRRVQLKSYRP